jgi:hypothetical protein
MAKDSDRQTNDNNSSAGLIVTALQSHFRAKRDEAVANLSVFVNRPAGVGEHHNLLKECVELVRQVSEAEEGMRTVQQLFAPSPVGRGD